MIVRVLGTDDSVNTCDCCGRADLKSTVALETEAGEVVHYGVVCAAQAMKRSAADVRKDARKADAAKREADRAAQDAARQAEHAAYCAWLSTTYGVSEPAALWGINVAPIEALRRYRAEVA